MRKNETRCGKIIRVRIGDIPVAQEETMGVVVDGIEGDFFDGFQELLFIPGAAAQHLLHFPAAHEKKMDVRPIFYPCFSSPSYIAASLIGPSLNILNGREGIVSYA